MPRATPRGHRRAGGARASRFAGRKCLENARATSPGRLCDARAGPEGVLDRRRRSPETARRRRRVRVRPDASDAELRRCRQHRRRARVAATGPAVRPARRVARGGSRRGGQVRRWSVLPPRAVRPRRTDRRARERVRGQQPARRGGHPGGGARRRRGGSRRRFRLRRRRRSGPRRRRGAARRRAPGVPRHARARIDREPRGAPGCRRSRARRVERVGRIVERIDDSVLARVGERRVGPGVALGARDWHALAERPAGQAAARARAAERDAPAPRRVDLLELPARLGRRRGGGGGEREGTRGTRGTRDRSGGDEGRRRRGRRD